MYPKTQDLNLWSAICISHEQSCQHSPKPGQADGQCKMITAFSASFSTAFVAEFGTIMSCAPLTGISVWNRRNGRFSYVKTSLPAGPI